MALISQEGPAENQDGPVSKALSATALSQMPEFCGS
jgi:hypothetical protein